MNDNQFGPTEMVMLVLICTVILGAPIAALVSMRRNGRRWARIRLVSYSATAILYALNSIAIFAAGNGAGGGTSGIIAWFSGKGAIGAWRAWRTGDYRPAYMRVTPTEGAQLPAAAVDS